MTDLTPSAMMRNAADWLEAQEDISYEVLARGPLGPALTRVELEGLADDTAAVATLITHLRQAAAYWERRA